MAKQEWDLLRGLTGSTEPKEGEPNKGGWQFISFWGALAGINFKAPSMAAAKELLGEYGTIFTQDDDQSFQLGFSYEVKGGLHSSVDAIKKLITDIACR